jgi:hypothetical protein
MTKTMWLSRDKNEVGGFYNLWLAQPIPSGINKAVWMAGRNGMFIGFAPDEISQHFPSLRLRPGQCIKVKVTNTKTGVSIRRV